MSELGQSIHESLIPSSKTPKAKCKGCGSSLELFELDFRRSSKVMRCTRCGMLHMYKKDIIGKWRLFKAQKADIPPR